MNEEKKTKWSTIIIYVLVFWFVSYFIASSFSNQYINLGANVAYIPITGEITLESSGDVPFTQSSSSNTLIGYIEQAAKNDNIKAIILEIDSPGGTVVASEEMANAIKAAKTKKPVIAWIREEGASGAYWVASAATVIVASDTSITGSIGVTASYLQFADLMKNYGVGYEKLAAGKYKEITILTDGQDDGTGGVSVNDVLSNAGKTKINVIGIDIDYLRDFTLLTQRTGGKYVDVLNSPKNP